MNNNNQNDIVKELNLKSFLELKSKQVLCLYKNLSFAFTLETMLFTILSPERVSTIWRPKYLTFLIFFIVWAFQFTGDTFSLLTFRIGQNIIYSVLPRCSDNLVSTSNSFCYNLKYVRPYLLSSECRHYTMHILLKGLHSFFHISWNCY